MSLPSKKVPNDFPFKHSGNPDKYGQSLGGDYAQVQSNFDARAIYNQNQINAILDALASVTDGDSGADNVKATPLNGGTADTIQGILEELKTSEGVLDAQNVKITGNQTVNGIKTFTSSPIVPTPINSTHASSKGYVDASIGAVVLGQIPDDSLANSKLGTDIKVGSLSSLLTTIKSSVTDAINELFNNKLDSSSYTANDVLAKVKTVDGAGSGLDADTIDNKHASDFFQQTNYGSIITKSASAILALTDSNMVINMTGASSQTITIPPNSSVAFPIGAQITFIMSGAGAVVFAPGSGVTLQSKDTKRTIDGQYASATLIKIGTDTWSLIGALKA